MGLNNGGGAKSSKREKKVGEFENQQNNGKGRKARGKVTGTRQPTNKKTDKIIWEDSSVGVIAAQTKTIE